MNLAAHQDIKQLSVHLSEKILEPLDDLYLDWKTRPPSGSTIGCGMRFLYSIDLYDLFEVPATIVFIHLNQKIYTNRINSY